MAVTKQTLDFTNVKEGGSFNKSRIPAGDYKATVAKVEDAKTKAGKFNYLFTIKLVGKHASAAFPYYCGIEEKDLWKIRNLFVSAGLNIPKRKFSLDPTKVIKKTFGVAITDTEYEGKAQSEISAIFPAAELDLGSTPEDDDTEVVGDDEDTEEEPEPVAEVEDEEEEPADEGDQFDGMDRDALKLYIKGNNADFKVFKSTTDDALREEARRLAAVEPEGEVEEEVEEDEEEEEIIVPPAKTAPKRPAKPAARPKRNAPAEDEELDIEDM